MGDITSINQYGKPAKVLDTYKGGIKVFLESEADLVIFKKKWFVDLNDEIDFQSAEPELGKGGGGYNAVLERVSARRDENEIAYGIVDRDSLLERGAIFWEIDNDKFHKQQPFDKYIHVLKRWEIENYLLHPDVLAELIADKKLSFSTPSAAAIAQMILDTEEDLITVTTLSTIGVPKGKSPEEGFGYKASGDILREKVLKHLNLSNEDNIFEQHRAKIKSFAENTTDPITRWDKLSRLLDGKRMLYRLQMIFNQEGLKDMASERGVLADKTKKLGLVDAEILDFFENILET